LIFFSTSEGTVRMSRSDFWSIAATLIVTGVGYFVGGQKTAAVCIALGVFIVLYLLLTYKKKGDSPSVSVRANPQMIANPQMTANPSVHVHLPGSEKREKPPLPAKKPRPQHNLQLHSFRMAQIEESLGRGGPNGFHLAENQSKPNAAIVCIRNKSRDGEVSYIGDVRAALTFRDSGGREIGGGISQACWVDNQLRNANFDLEETKCVIAAVMHRDYKDKIVGASTPYIQEQMTGHGMALSVESYELDENVSTVEVILLSKNSRVMEPMKFELSNEDGKPGIRLVSEQPPS
jgi:hypothetical protein